jgi:hypothetical protein
MRTPILAAALAATLAAVPAAAQPSIQAGQTVNGRLEASDPRLPDDSHYDQYVYRGRAGERIVITLRSGDFDAFLHWGTLSGRDFEMLEVDDDGGGGTDSRLEVTVGSGGTFAIRANSLGGGETGAYTLSVQAAGSGPAPSPNPTPRPGPGAQGRTIRAGQTVNGRITSADPELGDGSNYQQWLYEGRAGEQVVVTLASADFDAFLRWGRMSGGAYEHIGYDDDGAGGTDSRLTVTLDRAGTYAFQANTFGPGMTGSYTLSVRSTGAGESAPSGVPTLTLGSTVQGQLRASDPKLPDDSHYHQYVYRGRPGERVLVTMRSTDFDTYLLGGTLAGGEFQYEQHDDDSGGGTDAQLVATVGPSGVYAVQANSYGAGMTGRYAITVQPVGAGPRPAPTPAGARTIAAGQTQRGTLRAGDPMLSDSSYYHEYHVQGTPGDRLEITLASSDFDTYLRWGRVAGGNFAEEAYDDDGGGGTNSRLEVTLGGSGSYAVHANAFFPGTTGAYTLTVRELGAGTPAPTQAERSPSSLTGKWMHAYVEPQMPRHRPLGTRMQQSRALEGVVDALNAQFPMPRNVNVRMDQCGVVNAFYSPRDGAITFCYEMLEHLAGVFAGGSVDWTQEQRDAVEGAYTFIMMHEVGHALIHQLDLPVTGREEDAVDQLATVTLISGGDKGAQAALAGALSLQPGRGHTFDESDYAGEHSLGPQRLYNVMCWIYGSDPAKYAAIVTNGSLPRDRAVRCANEWERMSKAWQRILEPHRIR